MYGDSALECQEMDIFGPFDLGHDWLVHLQALIHKSMEFELNCFAFSVTLRLQIWDIMAVILLIRRFTPLCHSILVEKHSEHVGTPQLHGLNLSLYLEELQTDPLSQLPLRKQCYHEIHESNVCIQGCSNVYTLGSIRNHNVVVVVLPAGQTGTASAAAVASEMHSTFRSIDYALLIGVAGGAPGHNRDIRLGDVVVSMPSAGTSGVVAYDSVKDYSDGKRELINGLNIPPIALLSAANVLRQTHRTLDYLAHITQIVENDPRFRSPVIRSAVRLPPMANTRLDVDAVLERLFVCRPEVDRRNLIDIKGKRAPGTCEWVIKDPKYLNWVAETTSEVLVVTGSAGQGKTMLSIHLTEVLEGVTMKNNGVLLYFFCSSKDANHNTETAILKGLLYQLLQRYPHLFKLVRQHFTTPKLQDQTISDITLLWKIFDHLLRNGGLGPVYCVVDGLDECDIVSTSQLLAEIRHLREVPVPRLSLLLLCRTGPCWIESMLGLFPRMDLDSVQTASARDDMEKYIAYQIAQIQMNAKLSKSTLERVRIVLQNGAPGARLWVQLVAQTLQGKTEAEVNDYIRDVPKGIDGIYRRTVSLIPNEQHVAPIIHWVSLSRRAVTISELIAATGVVASERQSAQEIIKSRIKSCRPMISIDSNDTVSLVHQSAKDYLRKHDPHSTRTGGFFATEDKHMNLARACLDSIHRELGISNVVKNPQKDTLLRYAIAYLPDHLKLWSDSVDHVLDLSGSFFQDKSPLRTRWWKAYWKHARYGEAPMSFTLLHFAAYFDLTGLARQLLKAKTALPFKNPTRRVDSYGRTPLFWAASRSNQPIMDLLLRNGAEVNARDHNKMTALHLAAQERHTGAIPFLLRNGANLALKDRRGNTPLTMAIKIGSREVIRLLLTQNSMPQSQFRKCLPGLPSDWLFKNKRAPEDELVKLQYWFLFGDWGKLFQRYLPLAGGLSALLRSQLLSKITEKVVYNTLRRYEATDGEMVLDLLTNGDCSKLMEEAVDLAEDLLNAHGPRRMERLWGTMFGPGFRVQEENKSLIDMVVQSCSLGVATACRMKKRDVVDTVTNIAAQGFYYGYQNGYLEIVQTICHRFMSELTASLMTQDTSQSTNLISVGVNLYVAIQDVGDKGFEKEISIIWVGTVREMFRGNLKERAIQSFAAGCLDELCYRVQRHEIRRIKRHIATISTLAELGGQEFADTWAIIIGTVMHRMIVREQTEEVLRPVMEEWVGQLNFWRLQVLAEFLVQAKQSQTPLPSFLAPFVPDVLVEFEKLGLGGGLKREYLRFSAGA
ncbi:hypothetical protein FE257_001920 [Aspergillus nanangensis]|uniref:NACHT domain-containing protein n=1 Tax=Aspergillus nanangensis TaxID=2582783 RepID=A0AAD4GPC1_ASPNN|nr:hypothetical protein FE257_001920 [Aspergillus nanangensis]